MDLEKVSNPPNLKELALSTFYYISGSIFGPLLIFMGLGYFLDKILKTKPVLLIFGFFIAFVTSNVLMFKKVVKLNKKIDTYKKPLTTEEIEKNNT